HARIHQRRRMQAVDRDGGVGELFCKVESERDQRELAAIVGAYPGVVVVHPQVREVYWCLPSGCDVDDPRWCTGLERGNKFSGQQYRGEVIDREALLVAICAEDPFAVRGSARAYSCIVDQEMKY